MSGIFAPVGLTQETAPVYDPDTDPRIDRREHPNAPRLSPPASPLEAANTRNKEAQLTDKDDPIFLAFATWIQKYRLAADAQKAALAAEGAALAKMRRAALLELIKKNPKRAIEWAVSHENHAILPAQVQEQLEQRVAGCGDYEVLIARPSSQNNAASQNNLPSNGSLRRNPPNVADTQRQLIMRYATIGAKRYKAYVYGWRHGLTTKYNISLHGIAVDNLLALSDAPARVLEAGEVVPTNAVVANPDRKCPLCGKDYQEDHPNLTAVAKADTEKSVIAQIGSIYYYFDNLAHLRQIEAKLIQGLAVIGPRIGGTCDQPLDAMIAEIKAEKGEFPKAGAGNNGVPAGDF